MKSLTRAASRLLLAVVACLATAGAHAGAVGVELPADFPVILDASLGEPLIGFGATGTPTRTPVVFVHGNNDTPFPTACNPYGRVQAFAEFLADSGYASNELWAVGYQGDQCDLPLDQTLRSGPAHTTSANVPDVRAFVLAVLRYTGARQVDVVAHSLGSVIVREWLRQHPDEGRFVRRFVAIDGPNHGIINCSPNPLNYWQAPSLGGFTPASAVCQELGSPEHAVPEAAEQGPGGAGCRQGHAGDPQCRHELRLLRETGRHVGPPCLPRTRSGSPPTSRAARA